MPRRWEVAGTSLPEPGARPAASLSSCHPTGLQNGENTFQQTPLRLRWIFRHRDDDSSPAPGRAHPDPGQRAADVRGHDQAGDPAPGGAAGAAGDVDHRARGPRGHLRRRRSPGSAGSSGMRGTSPFRVGVAADAGRLRADETWRVDIGRAFDPDDTPEQVLRTLSQSPPGGAAGHRRLDRHRRGGPDRRGHRDLRPRRHLRHRRQRGHGPRDAAAALPDRDPGPRTGARSTTG